MPRYLDVDRTPGIMKLKYILLVYLFANAWATSTHIHSRQKNNNFDIENEVHISSVLDKTESAEESVLLNKAAVHLQDQGHIASNLFHGSEEQSSEKRSFVSSDHGSPINEFRRSFQGQKAEGISIKSSGTLTIPLTSTLAVNNESNIQNIQAEMNQISDVGFNQDGSEIPVRKCCEEHEFYNIQSQQCESAGGNSTFLTAVEKMFVEGGTHSKLNTIAGIIRKCPNSGSPPQVTDVSPFSHTLLPSGDIKDSYSSAVYDHNQYCLEVASFSRENLDSAPVVLAHCLPKEQNSLSSSLKKTVVRKCCANNEHFSTFTHLCEPGTSGSIFRSHVENVLSNLDSSLSFIHGKIKLCPSTEGFPEIRKIDPSTHAISPNGHLIELISSAEYNHKDYCVELAMGPPGDLETSDFVAAYCPKDNYKVPIRKCCNLNQYLDNQTLTCKDRGMDMSNYNNLIHDFFHRDPPATKILVGKLRCESNKMKRTTANEMYLDKTGQLCGHSSGNCYPSSSYCIEHFGSRPSSELESRALVCSSNSFRKCCPLDEVLSDTGCVKPGRYYTESSRLSQLKELLLPKPVFRMAEDPRCEAISVSSSESDLHWWVNKYGALSLRTTNGEITTEQYCVDDFEGKEMVETTVMLCRSEIQELLPRATTNYLASSNSIGKCCPIGQYINEDFSCVESALQTNLTKEREFVTANITDMTFTSFPACQQGPSYHIYMFGQRENNDFATLTTTKRMKIVYKDRGCISYQHILENSEYCLDDYFTGSGMDAIIAVCPEQWKEPMNFLNKYKILLALSSISCISLIITAVFLIITRAKRTQETLNKAEKLSGKMQLCFVISNLMAFILLDVGTQRSFNAGPLCYTFASFLMFFILAAFMWNTSICLESLLHKMRSEIPESTRFLCHAFWAWGVPGAITTIGLTLDLNRDALPCSTVTPNFGVYQCFFSDRTAKLLYLYLPMFVSICANVVLLLLTKYVNTQKARRLSEKLGTQSSIGLAEDDPDETEQAKIEIGKRPRSIDQTSLQFDNEYLGIGAKESMWTKYFKLITWSGVMWVFEFANFLISDSEELSESWYNCLWYIPSSINALRGTALFLVMVVLMPQYRPVMMRLYKRVWSPLSSCCGSS